MTLKLAVTITADAASAKSEFASTKVSVQDLGTTAASAAAGVATVEKALETAASAARQAQSANTALATSQTTLAASGATAAQSTRQLDQALDVSSRASREAATALGGLAGAQSALEGSSAQLATHLDRAAISADKFESSALAMVQVTANLEAALKQTADAQARFNDQFSKKPANDNPTKPQTEGAEQLRAKYDELYAIGLRYKEQVAEIRQGHADGKIGFAEMGAMIDRAGEAATRSQDAYVKMNGGLRDASGAVRLTTHQMSNLSYQVNDIGTMFLMGASPFQIMASQAGQVYQALGDGPQGVGGSLQAIGNSILGFARAIPPAAYAVAGVTAAVGALWYMTKGSEARSAEESLETFESAVKRIEVNWQGAAAAARQHYEAAGQLGNNPNAAFLDIQGNLRQLGEDFRNTIRDLNEADLGGFGRIIEPRIGSVSAARQQLQELYIELRRGEATAEATAEALLEVTLDPSADGHARAFADALRQALQPAIALERQMQALNRASSQLAAQGRGTTGRFAIPDDVAEGLAGRINPGRYDDIRAGLDAQTTELTEADRALRSYSDAVDRQSASLTSSVEQLRLQVDMVGQSEGAIAAATFRLQAMTQAQRDADEAAGDGKTGTIDADLVQQIERDAAAIGRLTDAMDTATKAEQARKRERQEAAADQRMLESLQLEFDLVGRSVGEVARLRAEFTLLARAKDAAIAAGGTGETVALTNEMREQAAEVGRLTEATARLNLERGQAAGLEQLQAELGLVRLGENARQIALAGLEAETELRRQGIAVNDEWGRSYTDNARRAAGMQVEIDRQTDAYDRQRSVLENVASSFIDMFDASRSESFFDSVMKGLADIGRQFAELGKQKILETIFGQAISYTTGTLAVGQRSTAPTGVAIAANQSTFSSAYAPTPTQRPEFVGQAAAAVSGQVLTYAGRFNKAVDGRLMTILETAATRFPLQVEAISGLRPGDKRFHGRGLAADVQIYGSEGQRYGNYQNARDFRVYEQFAQEARRAQRELFPELDKLFRWGGYFSGGKGKYGALDSMHFDLGGAGMGGGTWEGGLTAAQRRLWAGAESVGMGGSSAAIERAVQSGTTNALRSAASGTSSYMSGAVPVPTARPASQTLGMQMTGGGVSGGFFGQGGRLQSMLSSPFGQGAMNALGAFGAGQQGGYASGALTGGLGAIGMGLGPVGIIAGIGGGLLGGLFGGREKRRQEHQQKAQAWEAQAGAWNAFQNEARTGTGATSNLRANQVAMADQLTEFVRVGSAAWKNGSNNSSALFSQTGSNLGEYFKRTNAAFAGGFGANVRSLDAGQGMEGPFIQARDGIVEVGKSLLTFVDDARHVFGDGSEEVRRATEASIVQLRAMVSGGAELSEVGVALEALSGAGNALGNQLMQLGVSFEDATREVGEAAHTMITRIRGDFVQGIDDQIAALDGKSYLADVRETIVGIDLMLKDAAALNVDRSLVDNLFAKQAQAIVNGAELTGEAFADLVTQFPRLSGVVTEFSEVAEEAAERTTEELTSVRQSYLDRYYAATNAGDLAAFERKAQAEREAEAKAGGAALSDLEKALSAERAAIVLSDARQALDRSYRHETETLNDLLQVRQREASELQSTIGSLRSFVQSLASVRDDMRVDDNLSTLGPQARLDEARRQFKDLAAKAEAGDEEARSRLPSAFQEYMTESKDFHRSSEGYYRDAAEADRIMERTLATGQRQLTESEKQLARLERQIDQGENQIELLRLQYETALGTNEGIQSLAEAMAAFVAATGASRREGATVPGANPGLPSGSRSEAYLVDNRDVLRAISAGETFGLPAGSSIEAIAKAHYDMFGRGEGRKYVWGGFVRGAGTGSTDSITARLSHGEYVMPSAATSAIGVATLDTMRATKSLPMPDAVLSVGRAGMNDNGAVVAAIGALGTQLQQVRLAIMGGDSEARKLLGDLASKSGTTIATLRRAVDALEAA